MEGDPTEVASASQARLTTLLWCRHYMKTYPNMELGSSCAPQSLMFSGKGGLQAHSAPDFTKCKHTITICMNPSMLKDLL